MFNKAALLVFSFLAVAYGQQAGTETAEVHPPLTWETCTASGCTTNQGTIVLDSNWRWLHDVGGYTNCYTGNTWNTEYCPDAVTCAANCALDGAEYEQTYGITTSGNALTLDFVTTGSQTNVGSRVYLMASDDTNYEIFTLLNKEFSFDVDVSNLPCGLNGALYFSEMMADGGLSEYSGNKAGAKYGTGYCDSQCPQDLKFINGEVRSTEISVIILICFSTRLTLPAGHRLPMTPMQERVTSVLAAMRWMFGKPTPFLLHSPPTHVPFKVRLNAPVNSAPSPTDTMAFAILMVATSTLSVWATRPSMVLA